VADKIYKPGIGPTKTNSTDALDATLPNPDTICITGHIEYFLSSKLYPLNAQDAMAFSTGFLSGWKAPIPQESIQYTQDALSGSYIQKRWYFTDGPYEESLEYTQDVLSASYIQKRWFFVDGPYEESIQYTQDVLEASYEPKLIFADTPDEKLQLSMRIGTCSMDLI